MQESNRMNSLNALEDLRAEPKHAAYREAASRLTSAQFGQVLALDCHHHVVELLVAPAADEATHVVFACWARGKQLCKYL